MIIKPVRTWLKKFTTYHIDISTTNGRFSDHIFTAYAQSVDAAIAQALHELRHQIPTGTLVVYHYPVVHRMPWELPNSLTAVYDYTPRQLYRIPLPLHFKRIAPHWQQLHLLQPPP